MLRTSEDRVSYFMGIFYRHEGKSCTPFGRTDFKFGGGFSLINLTELLHVELFSICLNANWHICIDKPSGRAVYLKFRVKMRVVELPDEWWAFHLKTWKAVGLQPFMSLYVYINPKVAPLSHQNCGPIFTRCVCVVEKWFSTIF